MMSAAVVRFVTLIGSECCFRDVDHDVEFLIRTMCSPNILAKCVVFIVTFKLIGRIMLWTLSSII